MYNFETVVNKVMEHLSEDKILIMFPESRYFDKIETREHTPDEVTIESGEHCEEIIEAMLKDTDPELLPPAPSQVEIPLEFNQSSNKELAHALDVQLESLGETLQRLRYYLHEIEQFLPEKNRRQR